LIKVVVAFICDGNYVIPTAVAITSLICNKNLDTHYDIYIITSGLSELETEKFYQFKASKIDIHIIRTSVEKYEGLQNHPHITTATYLKFELPEFIPNEEKVLYLDSDIIIQKDLTNLFEINIEDYYAAAVKDLPLIDNPLNIKNYFNSGVMLLNLKLMRENNISSELLHIAKSSAYRLTYQDQDCLNIYFDKKVKLLSVIYNYFYSFFLQQRGKYTIESINKYFGTNYSSYDDIKKDSYIIHMVGYDKPWIYSYSLLVSEWDEYFKKSPFKFYKLKRQSIKIKGYILSVASYIFYKYWYNNNFKLSMQKLRKSLSHYTIGK